MRTLPIQTSNRRGFTIIEVVLVLAIAGLIFLMVFIALPNMQSAQRNTQRRNDYNSLSTQITNYATNHNGAYPTTILSTWFNSQGTDPDGEPYAGIAMSADGGETLDATAMQGKVDRNNKQAYVVKHAKCTNTGTVTNGDGAAKKEFAIVGYVEEGANVKGTYCLSSHI